VQLSVEADTLDDLLRDAMQGILEFGEENSAKRGETKEVIGAILSLSNPRARLSRTEKRRRASTAIAELCWYLRGTNEGDPITFWIPAYTQEVEDNGLIHGGYGPRLFGENEDAQVARVIEQLKAKPGSRRAVIQLFDRSDVTGDRRYHDVPCTCTIQFFQRADNLHIAVCMRSNDVYIGLPNDIFVFTMLQEIVARELGVEPGRYVHMVGSLHMYEQNIRDADQFLREGWQSTDSPMPPMPPGSQRQHIVEALDAEEGLRSGVPYSDLALPQSPYWADLVKVLALRLASRNDDAAAARLIASQLSHQAFSEFS
jgi:thymidylate synthase